MSAAKHTPGPWVLDWNVSRIDVFSSDATALVATVRRSAMSAGIDSAARANARLIAAAPCLLDALRAMLDDDDHDEAKRKARAAIAKAAGEGA